MCHLIWEHELFMEVLLRRRSCSCQPFQLYSLEETMMHPITLGSWTWSSAEYEYSSSVKVLNNCKAVRVRKFVKLQSTSPIRSDEISESSLKSPGRPGHGFTPLSKEVST
ncbi:hypothetical protein MTR67_020591 [Solanum verrucosum]|uniref:Uncharacterized protein n=1 Tax=Solanum verrucosum TaxID=315347 RepID=A0AAF0QV68_SOLVR|nr:hypothetical protein MTR67_020591 [Solanum verrucosum]